MGDASSKFALAVSIASALFAGLAWWNNREKLRFDLYNRRFDIYSRTLDLHYLVQNIARITPSTASFPDVYPELDRALQAFTRARRESKFLFNDESRIYGVLDQFHTDVVYRIESHRGQPHKAGDEQAKTERGVKYEECCVRAEGLIPMLEREMAKYLNFHTLLDRSDEY